MRMGSWRPITRLEWSVIRWRPTSTISNSTSHCSYGRHPRSQFNRVFIGSRMPADYVSMSTLVPVRNAVLGNQPRCVTKIRQEMYASVDRMLTTEHVVLESDFREVPCLQDARTVHARIEFRSRLRRRVLQLEIFDYYYLSVRSHSRSIALEYVLDLRFVDAPRRLRHIAWRWITFSLLLIALSLEIASRIDSSATPWWQHAWLPVCVTVIVAWPFATLVGVYRTTETVSLFSTHGGARLLECTGGLGTFRVFRPFMAKLAAHIRLASAAR